MAEGRSILKAIPAAGNTPLAAGVHADVRGIPLLQPAETRRCSVNALKCLDFLARGARLPDQRR